MASTIEDAKAMIRAADQSKGTLNVIFQNRYNASTVELTRIIDSGESLEIALLDNLFLSGVKMIDGQLHIQFHCHDPHMEQDNGVMYRPCEVWTDLQDENGDDLPYVTEETHDETRVLSWGLTGSFDLPEWEEIILPVDAAKLENAGTLPILIRKNLGYVNADFQVNIPQRLIGNR